MTDEKYKKAKDACKLWQAENLKIREENIRLQKEVERWKQLSEELPDIEEMENLNLENKTLSRTIKNLKKEIISIEEKYKDKINVLERDKIILEGKVQHLEETKKDLQERYSELKMDYRNLLDHKSEKRA